MFALAFPFPTPPAGNRQGDLMVHFQLFLGPKCCLPSSPDGRAARGGSPGRVAQRGKSRPGTAPGTADLLAGGSKFAEIIFERRNPLRHPNIRTKGNL